MKINSACQCERPFSIKHEKKTQSGANVLCIALQRQLIIILLFSVPAILTYSDQYALFGEIK